MSFPRFVDSNFIGIRAIVSHNKRNYCSESSNAKLRRLVRVMNNLISPLSNELPSINSPDACLPDAYLSIAAPAAQLWQAPL
jgi:hypothetical protein